MLQESSKHQPGDATSPGKQTPGSAGKASPDQSALEALRSEYEKKIEEERKAIRDEASQILQEDHRRAMEELIHRLEDERRQMLEQERDKAHRNSVEAYRSLMMLTTQLEVPHEITQSLLRSLRATLTISETEHETIERELQVMAYINAVRETWKSGKPTPDELDVLRSLQRLYDVPDEEHKVIVDRVKGDLGLPDESATIYVIDDDQHILAFIKHVLKKTYQTLQTSSSIEDALPSLQKAPPALILCDVNLGSGKMGGFTFYEKILGGEYGEALKKVPFVLMSALTEDFFVKSAKELGVKSYLAKPFTRENLESTVKSVLA